jgi:hypothetical protein
MIVDFKDGYYLDKNGEKYKSAGQIASSFKNYMGNDFWAKYYCLKEKYLGVKDIKKYNLLLSLIYNKQYLAFEELFQQDSNLEDFEIKRDKFNSSKPRPFKPSFVRFTPINLDLKRKIKSKILNKVILYNRYRKVCALSGIIRIEKDGKFTITQDIEVEGYEYFFHGWVNYKWPLHKLPQSKAAKNFISLNFQAWILESFGYICTELFIRYYIKKDKQYYIGKSVTVPYVPRLVQTMIIHYYNIKDGNN